MISNAYYWILLDETVYANSLLTLSWREKIIHYLALHEGQKFRLGDE